MSGIIWIPGQTVTGCLSTETDQTLVEKCVLFVVVFFVSL